MALPMDISFISDQTFKIKGRTGITLTDPNGPTIESLNGEKKTFTGPGEYEVSGISIIGIPTDDGTLFIYEVDGLRICHVGKLKKKLPENKLSLIGDIDILLTSLGPETIEIIQQIESYYVIPFDYESQEQLDKFLKDSGLTVEKMPKFSLKKEEIIEESSAQVIVLEKN
jgi:hypothetical protein